MNIDFYTYLFLINKNFLSNTSKFNDCLFHFYRFFTLKNESDWQKIFIFNNYICEDLDFKDHLDSLFFLGFLNGDLTITEKGQHFLENFDPFFKNEIFSFFDFYEGESATQKSCFANQENFMISCNNCYDKKCLDKKMNIKKVFIDKIKNSLHNPYRSQKI